MIIKIGFLILGIFVLVKLLTKRAKPEGYLRGHYHNIPVYVKPLDKWSDGIEMIGRNDFSGVLVDCLLWWDTYVMQVEGYKIWIDKD